MPKLSDGPFSMLLGSCVRNLVSQFAIVLAVLVAVDVAKAAPTTLAAIATPTPIQSRGLSQPASWQTDAELTDVFFLDSERGWAVGAQGVTLRTVDGGATWLESREKTDIVAPTHQTLEQKLRTAIDKTSGEQKQRFRLNFDSRSRHRLESVWFTDPKNGWAAGGYDLPFLDRSRGVILRTTDGGETWRPIQNLVLPRIKQIRFSNVSNGWAIGETSNLSSNGIYYTADGGVSWSSQPAADDSKTPDWIAAQQTGSQFVAIDKQGRLARLTADGFEHSIVASLNGEPLRNVFVNAVKMINEQTGWSVGDSGVVRKSTNAGLSWSSAFDNGQAKELSQVDLKTLAVTENKIWFAGNPGNRIFSINHDGTGFRMQSTSSTAPIRKIVFADQQNGWAVGAMGTIHSTGDGGETWSAQRQYSTNVTLLTVSRSIEDVPLEMLARYGAEENFNCATALLSSTHVRDADDANCHSFDALAQASERAGAAFVFSIRDMAEVDEDAKLNVWLRKLVRTIRTLKPEAIVCDSEPDADGFSEEKFVDAAIRMAANRASFPDQISQLGLSTHQVQRLAVVDPIGEMGFEGQRLLPRLGLLLEDHLAISRTVLKLPVRRKNKFKYRVSRYLGRGDSLVRDPFGGELLKGVAGLSKRPVEKAIRGSLTEIRRASTKKRAFKQLLSWQANTPQEMLAWRQALRSVTQDLESGIAGVWLTQLAEGYLESGQPELTAFSLQQLISYAPNHDFAPMAMAWLAYYYSSSEFNQLQFQKSLDFQIQYQNANRIPTETGGGMQVQGYQSKIKQTTMGDGTQRYSWSEVPMQPPRRSDASLTDPEKMDLSVDVEQVAAESQVDAPSGLDSEQVDQFFRNRLKLATQYYSRLGGDDPELIQDADFKYLQAHIVRQFVGSMGAETYFKSIAKSQQKSERDVAVLARQELRLADKETKNQEISAIATRANQRPFLDGKFDDPVWHHAVKNNLVIRKTFGHPNAIRKTNSDGTTKPAVDAGVFAYDDQFLYLIFRCAKIKDHDYPESKQPRTRDADLALRDRIEIELDIDRDGRSAVRFEIDYRGWVNESCGSCRGWDPNWFVAHQQDAESWTVECAIPLKELVVGLDDKDRSPVTVAKSVGSTDPLIGSHWNLRLKRKVRDESDWWSTSVTVDGSQGPSKIARQPSGLHRGLSVDRRKSQLLRFK